jgi:hypothetical protein
MSMQTDVKAAYVDATATVFNGRARLRGVFVTPGSATGTVVIRDGGASGTVVFSTTTLASGAPFNVIIAAEGVLCATSIHTTVSGAATTAVVFYA